MVILVTGTRWATKGLHVRFLWGGLMATLESSKCGPFELVHGGARGVDTLMAELIEEFFQGSGTLKKFEANWGKYGPQAGPVRNREMVAYCKSSGRPVRVLAFPAYGAKTSKGTWGCLREAGEQGLRCVVEPLFIPEEVGKSL